MICFMVSCFGVLEESVAVWCNLCVSVTKCDVCVWLEPYRFRMVV